MVAKCAPFDMNLVFRTHPFAKYSDADMLRILRIKQVPGAKFVSTKIPSYEIIKNSSCVVGIFSTTLLEAIVFKKPGIVLFGKGYAMDGLNLAIKHTKELPETMMKIANKEFKMDMSARSDFLGKLHKHFIPLKGEFTPYGPLPSQESTKLVADNIVDYLKHCDMV
jgi:hypothetical protein